MNLVVDARKLIKPPVNMRDYNQELIEYEIAVAMCERAQQPLSGAKMEEEADKYLEERLRRVT